MTEILLQKQIGDDGLVYFDLQANAWPDHFLGLATDIQFTGDFQEAGYRGMQWGNSIIDLPVNLQPINMVKAIPEQGKIVVGITFKANNLPELQGGVLARFVFERDLLSAEAFGNQVLSVYDGARRDITDVDWRIVREDLHTVAAVVAVKSQTHGAKAVQSAQNTPLEVANLVQTNIVDQGYLEALNFRAENGDFSWGWGLGIPFLILLILLGAFVGRKALGKRQNNLGADGLSGQVKSASINVAAEADLA